MRSAALDTQRNCERLVGLIRRCHETGAQLCLEKFDFAVHQTHLIEEKTDSIVHLGLSKQLLKAMALLANPSQDPVLMILILPGVERTYRQISVGTEASFWLFVTRLALQLTPKSPETWAFRRRLLHECDDELGLVLEMAHQHKSNYHAWEHLRHYSHHAHVDKCAQFAREHIRDASVFAYISHLAVHFPNSVNRHLMIDLSRQVDLYPDNELLWTFRLRMCYLGWLCPKAECDAFESMFTKTHSLAFHSSHTRRLHRVCAELMPGHVIAQEKREQ